MIYVLVPAHNEAPTVGLLLWKVRQLFTSFNREYQLLVVNDGSTDATDEILAPYTRALPLTLITHRNRQGYARSLEALLRQAVQRTDRPRRDYAVTIQADFSESPEDVLELVKKLEGGADIVVADRRAGGGRLASLGRRILAALSRRRLGLNGASDVAGTMRAYRLAVIERLIKDHGERPFLGHQGWAADLELLARAGRHARTIESVTVSGARPQTARASRLRPLRELWGAWRAAVALKGLPAPSLAPDATPVASAERAAAAPVTRADRQRDDRRQHTDRSDRHQRASERQHEPRRQDDRPRQQRPPRGQRPKQGQQIVPIAPVEAAATDSPVGAAAPTPDSNGKEGGRRRKRRRGRGRGRGRGGRNPSQDQSLPATPPPDAPPPAA